MYNIKKARYKNEITDLYIFCKIKKEKVQLEITLDY